MIYVYRNYCSFGQVLIDKIAVMSGSGKKFRFTFEGEEHLHKMAGEKTGGILISGHAGNFEMAGFMLERIKAKVNVVMYDEEYRDIRDFLSTVTVRNFNVIPVGTRDNAHVFEINNTLRQGEILCIHGDRFLEGSKKLSAEFMGEEAYFPTGPFYLSMKFNVPVSFVFAMKESRFRYHFYATPLRQYNMPGSISERDNVIRAIIKDYISEFENKIRRYPAQWFNYYDFWEKNN